VRELEGFLVRALKESRSQDSELRPPRSVWPSGTTPPPEPPDADDKTVDHGPDPSKEEVLAAWARERGNISRVARRLRRGRNVVYRLMDVYGIKREETDP
jgi:transcriptional regulator of acetoin/glycerol metabolism